MSNRTATAVSWLWITSLLIATVGVSGQQIYCYCLGKMSYSLFYAEDACAAERNNQPPACCTPPQAGQADTCCEKATASQSAHGCTKKTTKVFQLKTEFTLQETGVEKRSLLVFESFFDAAQLPVLRPFYFDAQGAFPSFAHPPPSLSGRMRCVRYGVFRC